LAPTLAPSPRSLLTVVTENGAVIGGDDGNRTHDPLLAKQSDGSRPVGLSALKVNKQGV
jgi:hypothetical protein